MRGAHWLRPPHPALRATFSPLGRRGPESACPSKRAGSLRPTQTSQNTPAGSLRQATVRRRTNHCHRSTMRLPNMQRRRGTPSSPPRGEVPSACEAMRGPSARRPLASPPSSGATRHLLPAGEKRTGERLPFKKGREPPAGPDFAKYTGGKSPPGHRPTAYGPLSSLDNPAADHAAPAWDTLFSPAGRSVE